MRLRNVLAVALFLFALPALAQQNGFQLDRYEPTAPGEWFLAVEHPWYSSTRWFAGGLTLDYGHNPLISGSVDAQGNFTAKQSIVEHQLVGHVDLAGSLFDRVMLSASIPITFVESGNDATDSIGNVLVGPNHGVAAGDPRIGLTARLWKDADKDPISLHLAGNIWIPIGSEGSHANDGSVRGGGKVILAGLIADHVRWSGSLGYQYRPDASIGGPPAPGNSVGQELQLGLAAQWTDHERRWAAGPEMVLATVLDNPVAGSTSFFAQNFTSLELLASGHVRLLSFLMLSAGVGGGVAREPGTPDVRALLRLAYAPERIIDSDGDGVPDAEDACPNIKGVRTGDPATNGCPADRDRDGVPDDKDLCPDVPAGDHPDAKRPGCPVGDRDKDGVLDDADQCPDVPAGAFPDPAKPGCPLPDRDGDGIPDASDPCPDEVPGDRPDPSRPGCPLPPAPKEAAGDRDGDGVTDDVDQCPDVPAGLHPDPAKPGCPLADRDHDSVPDVDDACPDKPGAPDPDPKKNGCPGLVEIKGTQIVILQPVLFIPFSDRIDPKSAPVLDGVAKALAVTPSIKKVSIEGHTDFIGKPADNLALSERRAHAVEQWLVEHGVAASRLEARGFGGTRPISRAKKFADRAANRRVEFVIVDPAPPKAPAVAPAPAPAPTVAAPAPGKSKKPARPVRRRKRGR